MKKDTTAAPASLSPLSPDNVDQWTALVEEERRMGALSERLMLAARTGTVVEIDQVLAEGADPKRKLRAGETPFMRAVGSGNLAVARRLEPLSDVHALDDDGYTLLLWATHANDVAALEYALQFSDPKQQDKSGQTALMRAISGQQLDSVRFLAPVSDGTQANVIASTALMVAVRCGDPEIIRALIEGGAAAFGKRDTRGDTALAIAIENHNVLAMEALWPHAREELVAVEGLNPLPHASSVNNEAAVRLILRQAPWAIQKKDWADSFNQAVEDNWPIADLIAAHAPKAESDRMWKKWISSGKLAKIAQRTSSGPLVPVSADEADELAWSRLFPEWIAIRRAERESEELRQVATVAQKIASHAKKAKGKEPLSNGIPQNDGRDPTKSKARVGRPRL